MAAGWACVLAFDTDDPEFLRGFEAGAIDTRLRVDPGLRVVEMVHAANAEMMLRIGEATGRRVSARDLNDEWIEVTFEPSA
jgi:hypothetical protein